MKKLFGLMTALGLAVSMPQAGFSEEPARAPAVSKSADAKPAPGPAPAAAPAPRDSKAPAAQEAGFVPPEQRLEAFRKAEEQRIEALKKAQTDREAALKAAREAREEAARARASGMVQPKPSEEKKEAPAKK